MKFFKYLICLELSLVIMFCFNLSCFAESTTYVWSNNSDTLETATTSNENASNNLNNSNDSKSSNTLNTSNTSSTSSTSSTLNDADNSKNSNVLNLESESAILIEQTTGQVLYSHNAHEQLRPASVTKIMSILLIMEQIHDRKTIINRSNCLL